jgi:hypothetical protein
MLMTYVGTTRSQIELPRARAAASTRQLPPSEHDRRTHPHAVADQHPNVDTTTAVAATFGAQPSVTLPPAHHRKPG